MVSYVSRDGAFGGPVAVAAAQTSALAGLGQAVELFAGWDGRGQIGAPGVQARLHRALRGRLPLVAVLPPGLPVALLRRRRHLDVVHVHLGRDLVSVLTAVALVGWRGKVVLQPHGMVMPDPRPAARLLDALAIRPALARAHAVLALTEVEERGLRAVSRGRARIVPIRNGIGVSTDAVVERAGTPVALFLARLHPRKNAPLFVEAALRLLAEGVEAEFVVAGPDEGDLTGVRRLIDEAGSPSGIRYFGAVPPAETSDRLRGAALYVLPSVGEVFPMTVLEALAVGTPAVITTANGLAAELAEAEAAVVVPPTVDALADAMQAVLTDAGARRALAERGLSAARQRFSSRAVAERLIEVYRAPAEGR